jgi:hypothetical protein
MLKQIKRASPLILGAVAILIIWWIVDSSQAFQTCINESENSAANDPLQKHVSVFVRCLGAYVIDKNAAITALGTLAVAIFTAVLGGFTISLSKSTRIAAEAAQKAADAAFAAERARFFIVIDKHNLTEIVKLVESSGSSENSGIPGGDNICITYRFKNYGKTPGVVRELVVDSMIATDPVDPPALFLSTKDFPEYMIGASDSTKVVNYSPATRPRVSHVRSIGRNAARLWFFGRLYYDDVFGNHQVHRFYFRSKSPLGSDSLVLQPFEYKDYNQST